VNNEMYVCSISDISGFVSLPGAISPLIIGASVQAIFLVPIALPFRLCMHIFDNAKRHVAYAFHLLLQCVECMCNN